VLHFVLGIAGSGKSQYAEQLVAGYPGSAVYCGTLPLIAYYSDTIRRHRERRPSTWGLVELVGDPMSDLKSLSTALTEHRNLLLDGLSFYLLQLTTAFDLDTSEAGLQAICLIDYAAVCEGEILIVDAPLSGLRGGDEEPMIRKIHALLARRAHRITLVDRGRAQSLRYDEAMPLDRSGIGEGADPRLAHMLQSVNSRKG
jgi:adenosyl cobinamide kinase/adenosyl cobinamide phosphate guanylyltransferase